MVHRTLDEECSDQETMHLLIFLFMQFLAKPDTQHPTDEKALNRTQVLYIYKFNIVSYSHHFVYHILFIDDCLKASQHIDGSFKFRESFLLVGM